MDHQEPETELETRLDALDRRLRRLESTLAGDPLIEEILPESQAIAQGLLEAYAGHSRKSMPDTDDLLATFRAFVKGDPSLNAVRDNLRELVFYSNCVDQGRRDALPAAAEKMAVRTVRHVYLYLRSRCEQEGRLG